MDSTRALVVYYSRTGHTKIVAENIARMLRCETEELVDRGQRKGLLGYLRASLDATLGRRADLAPTKLDPSAYDLVIVGTPIWNASVSSPVRTYLMAERGRIKRLALFCTHGGGGSTRVLRQIERIAGRKPIASLVLRAAEVERGGIESRVRSFVDAAQVGREEAPSTPTPGGATPAPTPA